MKKLLLCLLAPVSLASAQPAPPISLQAGAVIALPAGAAPSALALEDFNQDFRCDIAVCQRGLGSVGVYLQTTDANFPNPAAGTYAAGLRPSGLVAVSLGPTLTRPSFDLVAISGPSSAYTLLTNNNDRTGTFTPVVNTGRNNYFGFGNPSINPKLLARDLNNNGWVDFIYSYDAPSPITIQNGVYWQPLERSTATYYTHQQFFQTNYTPAGFALDDFDRDGGMDVVTTNPVGNEFTVVFSYSPGQSGPCWSCAWYKPRLPSQGLRPVDVATGDVNRDLLPDIALAHEGSSEITLLLNLRNYQFGSAATYPLSGAPRQVLLQDLNNDGYPEMLVLTADNQLQVFQHTGANGVGRYGPPVTLATGADPVTLQLADMNGDFRPDVVVGCAGDHTVRVYLNRSGSGVLATRTPRLAGVSIYPNPAVDQVTVQRPAASPGPFTATMLDALGREVRRTALPAPISTVSVADLPRGMYVFRLTSPHGEMSQRLVVQ
jgi:hypothetical protein